MKLNETLQSWKTAFFFFQILHSSIYFYLYLSLPRTEKGLFFQQVITPRSLPLRFNYQITYACRLTARECHRLRHTSGVHQWTSTGGLRIELSNWARDWILKNCEDQRENIVFSETVKATEKKNQNNWDSNNSIITYQYHKHHIILDNSMTLFHFIYVLLFSSVVLDFVLKIKYCPKKKKKSICPH